MIDILDMITLIIVIFYLSIGVVTGIVEKVININIWDKLNNPTINDVMFPSLFIHVITVKLLFLIVRK